MASSAFHPAFHGGIALVAAALVGAAPSPSAAADAPAAARHEIVIQGLQYVPETLHVRRGDVVVWRNKDPFPHTATADGGQFDSGTLAQEKSWKYVATKSGSFPYTCALHKTMKGVLVVK